MAIRTAPKFPSTQPAKVRPTVERTKPAIAAPDVARGPGRPPSGKVRVTMLLDPAVVAKFKATGKGWQARINDVLAAARL